MSVKTFHKNNIGNTRQRRVIDWQSYLAGFRYTVNHIPVKDNIIPDILSRDPVFANN